jgi:hypothetical protein
MAFAISDYTPNHSETEISQHSCGAKDRRDHIDYNEDFLYNETVSNQGTNRVL